MSEPGWFCDQVEEKAVHQLARVCGSRLADDPYDVDALFTKGLILAKLGNINGAIEILEGVLSQNPEYPGGWRVLGNLYKIVGNEVAVRDCISKSRLYVE